MQSAEKVLVTSVFLGGVCLVLALVFFLQQDSGEAPLSQDNPVPKSVIDEGSKEISRIEMEAPTSSEAARERVVPEPRDPAEGERLFKGVIVGRLVSEFGEPVPDAVIKLNQKTGMIIKGDFADPKADEAPSQTGEDTSDEHGRFRLDGLAEADTLRLHISHSDYVPKITRIKAYDGKRRDLGDVILELGGALSGIVVDEDGRAVAGAKAAARPLDRKGGSSFFDFSSVLRQESDWKVTTGSDGFFRISGLPEGRVNVLAAHSDYPSTDKKDLVITKGHETGGVHIVMHRGLTISGRVVTEEDEPVEGADVIAEPPFDFDFENLENFTLDFLQSLSPVDTDGDGRFLVKGLKEGAYTLRVSADSFLPFRKEKVKAGAANLVVVMKKGGWLAGRVMDAGTGEGVASFSIDVPKGGPVLGRVDIDDDANNIKILKGEEAASMRQDPVDPQGAFWIEGLGRGEFDLLVKAEGYADERVIGLSSAPGEGGILDVMLWKESKVSGRLLSSSGDPVSGGEVILQALRNEKNDVASLLEEEGISLPFDVSGQGWDNVKQTDSREEGSFILRGVPQGSYRLTASHEMHLDAEPVDLEVGRGEEIDGLEIRLGLAGSIAGTVFDTDGNPLPGAGVMISRGGGFLRLIASGLSGGEPDFDMKKLNADMEGRFRIDGLEPGPYQVQMTSDIEEGNLGDVLNTTFSSIMDKGGPGVMRAVVEEGKVTEVNLYETMKGAIAGAVLEGGAPMEDMRIKLSNAELGPFGLIPLKTTRTDENGSYLFKALAAGKYDVKLDLRGHTEPMKETVTLKEGGMVMQDFILPTSRVTGTILDAATGEPVVGIKVTLKGIRKNGKSRRQSFMDALFPDASMDVKFDGGDFDNEDLALGLGGPPPVQTDGAGRYEILHVKEGEYRLSAFGGRYAKNESGPITLSAGSGTVHQDLALTPGFEVSGLVIDGALGNPVAFCRITCERLAKGKEEGEKVKTLFTKERGRFTFSGLTPGRYRLTAKKEGLDGVKEVTLDKADIKDLALKIR